MLFACIAFVHVSPVYAQPAPVQGDAGTAIDYEAWEAEANTIESLIAGERASTALFEARRSVLVGWRARFLAAESQNAVRIDTIESQIAALGPAPGDGESEPESIANRRAALAERLAQAQAPGLRATEAFNRANGLIAEIDAILTNRQAEKLLELEPSPLVPANWATALRALADMTTQIPAGIAENARDPEVRATARDNALAIVLGLVIGGLLVLRGRAWITRWGERALDRDRRRGRATLGFVVSLLQVILPVAGFVFILVAMEFSGLLTEDALALLEALLQLIISIYAAMWIGRRLFPVTTDRPAAFDAPEEGRYPARRVIFLIGFLMGLGNMAEVVANLDIVPRDARGVLILPVHIGLAYTYLRLARLLKGFRDEASEGETPRVGLRIAFMISRALLVIAFIGPILGAIGYVNAGVAVMVPTGMTLVILGIILALQPVVRDIYAVIFRTTSEAAGEALLPVLVNFTLIFASAPIIAMIWGVRPERLGELWARFLEGFTLGDARITPATILAVILVFAAGILVTRILQSALKTTVLPRTRLDTGARNAVSSGVGYIGIALALVIAITSAGIDLTALGFVLGALSVGIGFGLQNVVSNFVSGIILLIERPISEGDWIEVNGNMGIVRDISVRSTTIETFDKTDVIVPNADFISGTVTNWTRGNTIGRAIVSVGVAYGSDTRRVSDILLEIARDHPDVSTFPEPAVDFMGFGADSLDFRVRCILRDINKLIPVKTELHHRIAERFTAEGIEIPFAQRDIWLRNPEALKTEQQPAARPETQPNPQPEIESSPDPDE
ncbi:DUF3772 domain-containing protein [Gymnodinialimonas sp. 2305UL16-5]|uniref:DUF3772 domain-containing protein n=1 Tax=Gymnodinialimonas mytili TaxID=3126503 RepID=UPI0030A1EB67